MAPAASSGTVAWRSRGFRPSGFRNIGCHVVRVVPPREPHQALAERLVRRLDLRFRWMAREINMLEREVRVLVVDGTDAPEQGARHITSARRRQSPVAHVGMIEVAVVMDFVVAD